MIDAQVPIFWERQPDAPVAVKCQLPAGQQHVVKVLRDDRVKTRGDDGRGDGDRKKEPPVQQAAEITRLEQRKDHQAFDAATGQCLLKACSGARFIKLDDAEGITERSGTLTQTGE